MPVRIKKLVGTVLILIWLFFYVLFAMRLAAALAADANWVIQMVYYAFAGMSWIIPPIFVIQWMAEDDRRRNRKPT